MRQLFFIILVGLPSLAAAGQKLRCDAFKLPKQTEADTEFSGYFPKASKRECHVVTIPPTTSIDPEQGYYVGNNGTPYLRTVQKFTAGSGAGAFSLVVSEHGGQFSTSTEAGGVHLRLNLAGREFRTVSAQLQFRRQKVSFAEGDVIVRVTGARFESDEDCLAPTPFDLAFSWRGVDPMPRGAQEE